MSSNVTNYFEQPAAGSQDNYLRLGQGIWSINGELVTASAADLNNAGSGGGISFEQAIYVAKGGDDSNDGSKIDNPKLTLSSAIAAAGTPLAPIDIVCLDSGVYNENILIEHDNILIYAPAAILQPLSGDGITVNAASANSIGVNIAAIVATGANAINVVDANATNFRVGAISGDCVWDVGGQHQFTVDQANGDFTSTSGLVYLHALSHTGSTLGPFFGRDDLDHVGSTVFKGQTRISFGSPLEIAVGVTVSALHQGRTLYVNSGAGQVITLPQDSTDLLGNGYQLEVVRQGTGTVSFATEGSDIIIGGITQIAFQGGSAFVQKKESGIWKVSGNVS